MNEELSGGKRGQIAIEFLLLVGMSFFVVITFLVATTLLAEDHDTRRSYDEMNDYGRALQKELFLASDLEDGYVRTLNVPDTLNGLQYNISLEQYNLSSFIVLGYKSVSLYFPVPKTSGIIGKGTNLLKKENNSLRLN